MRDTSFSICKALAIILVVVSHAGAPTFVNNFIFQFHVPVFFICAGYFFSTRYLDDPATFVKHRFKRLYWPFVKWSLLFLVLHNLFFPLGLLSEQYGNVAGGVLHPYSWHDFFQRCWSVAFNMSGYDEFICGAFWFFRTLFLSGLGFLAGLLVLRKLRPDDGIERTTGILAASVFVLVVWKIAADLKVTGVAGGGYRELMGIFFMCAGFLFQRFRKQVPLRWPLATVCLIITFAGAHYLPSSMGYRTDFGHFFMFIPTALAGSLLLYYIACRIDAWGTFLKPGLVYVGERTLYIFAFHLLAFKIVSAVKVGICGLPWQMVGGHTVVNAGPSWYWMLYTFVGVGVPLLWLAFYRHWAQRVDLSLKSCVTYGLNGSIFLSVLAWKGISWFALTVWACIKGVCEAIKDIIQASSTKEE